MKVLYIIQRYLPAKLTGSEVVIATVAEVMAKQPDINVSLITSDTSIIRGLYDPRLKRLPNHEQLRGIAVKRLQVNWFIGSLLYVINRVLPWLDRLTKGQLSFRSFGPHLMGLEKAIVMIKPDIIHTGPMPLNHVYEAWQIARRHHISLVITAMMHFDVSMFGNALIYRILADADSVIAFTEYEKQRLVKKGLTPSQITVIPATYMKPEDFVIGKAADFRKKYQLGDDPVVLFLGTKAFDKGAIHLLDAWSQVRHHVPAAKLVLAGLPTLSWEKEKVKVGTQGIIDIDYLTGQDKMAALSACNVVCVPSRTESFGIVVPEAWAKGKPFIGGPTGATRELIDEGIDGYTVTFGDMKNLVLKIVDLLQHPAKAEKMGQAGLNKAKALTEELLIQKTTEVYQQALKGNKSS